MGSQQKWHRKWLNFSRKNSRRYALYTFLIVGFFAGLHHSPAGRILERQVSRPAEYRVRHQLGQDPKVDSRLVLYGLGDSALSYLDADDLDVEEWATVLENLAKRGASAVLVNRVFALPKGDKRDSLRRLSEYKTRFIALSFLAEQEIPGRTPLGLHHPEHQMRSFTQNSANQLEWLPVRSGYPYGPHPSIVDNFLVGHAMYNGEFSYDAFLRLASDKTLPLASLLPFEHIALHDDQIEVEGTVIPHLNGSVLVNFPHPSSLYAKTFNLKGPIARARAGEIGDPFPDGTIVLILSAMFTGNADMVQTPFGSVPGGFLSASVINSILTNQWISRLPAPSLTILLSGIPAFFLATLLSGVHFWIACFAFNLLLFGVGLGLFTYANLASPWLLTMCAFTASAATIFALCSRDLENTLRLTQEFLEGLVPKEKLRTLATTTGFTLEPMERTVTTVFIDLVGFSLIADQYTPKNTFRFLKEIIQSMIEVIHKHGGIVDKIHGDGVLCFFGYAYDGQESSAHHANAAVECALELRTRAITKAHESIANKTPVFPIRIGVNTSLIQIGNLGTGKKIEITLIGQGVNFSKRLESAADIFGILIGGTTENLLVGKENMAARFAERFVKVKHLETPEMAYECVPIGVDNTLKDQAIEAYRNQLGLKRTENRWLLPAETTLEVETSFGLGSLADFSSNGLGVVLDKYLSKDVSLQIKIRDTKGELEKELQAHGLFPLFGTVCWAVEIGPNRYRTGILCTGLNDTQKTRLLTTLRDWVETRKNAA